MGIRRKQASFPLGAILASVMEGNWHKTRVLLAILGDRKYRRHAHQNQHRKTRYDVIHFLLFINPNKEE